MEYLTVHAGPAAALIRLLHPLTVDDASAALHGAVGLPDTSRGGLVEGLLHHQGSFASVLGVPMRGVCPPVLPCDASSP